jgi:hypothetical protein
MTVPDYNWLYKQTNKQTNDGEQKQCNTKRCRSQIATNSVECYICRQYQCFKCVGKPDSMDADVFSKIINSDRILIKCENCVKKPEGDALYKMLQTVSKNVEELSVKVEKGERDRAAAAASTSAIPTYSEVAAKNCQVKAEISSSVALGVAEVQDRNSRSNNIMLYGFPDSGDSTDEKSELKLLRDAVASLDQTDKVKVDPTSLLNCSRMGRFRKKGRNGELMNRPVKIMIKNDDNLDACKSLLLFKGKAIANCLGGGDSGFCREDLTKLQLDDLFNVRDQVKKLRASNKNKGFRIRFSNGVHSIFELVPNDSGKMHLRPFSQSLDAGGSVNTE